MSAETLDDATAVTTDAEPRPADLDGDGDGDAFEKLLVLVATFAAAAAARKVMAVVWKVSTGRTPPNGEDGRADPSVVLLWGAAAGAAVGAARLLAERQARTVARRRNV
jgi:hypothetical protein